MKTKSSSLLMAVLLLGSIAFNVYLFNKSSAGVGMVCGPDTKPTYKSIGFAELKEKFDQYMKENENDPNATRSVYVSFEDLQNYMCVVRKGADENNLPVEGLGINIYFMKSNGQLNLGFVPSNLVESGVSNDWPKDVLEKNIGSEQTYLMNRMSPCPMMCGNTSLR